MRYAIILAGTAVLSLALPQAPVQSDISTNATGTKKQLADRQSTARKPFKRPADAKDYFDLCGNGHSALSQDQSRSEACSGTTEFCAEKYYEGTAESFASPEACLDSRLLEWKSPTGLPVDCVNGGFTEYTCGTERFCQGFDENPKPFFLAKGDDKFNSSRECFEAHEPQPSVIQSSDPLRLLEWKEPTGLPDPQKPVRVQRLIAQT